MTAYRELLLGCGRSRVKRIDPRQRQADGSAKWEGLVTLDNNPDVKPDILLDLDNHAQAWRHDFLPNSGVQNVNVHPYLGDDFYDEVHAYEVLEHLGHQGNAREFFFHFSEIWRLLKPNGYLCATVPSRFSPWLWGDPSHRRVIYPESLIFLDQSEYIRQCDAVTPTAMSDFRYLYKADFRCIAKQDNRESFLFILQAVKPSRWVAPK